MSANSLSAYLLSVYLSHLGIFKSYECSEDSYIGLGKILKVSNNYRCAFIYFDLFLNALKYN